MKKLSNIWYCEQKAFQVKKVSEISHRQERTEYAWKLLVFSKVDWRIFIAIKTGECQLSSLLQKGQSGLVNRNKCAQCSLHPLSGILFHDTSFPSETKRNYFYDGKLNFCVQMISPWDQYLNPV